MTYWQDMPARQMAVTRDASHKPANQDQLSFEYTLRSAAD
jgi:hypothetical protein